MLEGLLDAVLAGIQQYGFLAVFVYMVLETAFVLHYVPSEVVVPVAATQLVHGPLTFALFVVDTTAGATVGSVLAYLLFGRYGRNALERYGHVVHISAERLDWSERVFRRYGESSVFWGRLLPFVRAFISLPAGLAEMEFRRFVAYSAAGALLFNTVLTALVASGSDAGSPVGLVVAAAGRVLAGELAYVTAHPRFVVVLVGIAVLLAAAVWLARDWIRAYPESAKQVGLQLVRAVALAVGGLFVLGALSSPEQAFGAITAVWNDPLFWVAHGFSERVALLIVGGAIAVGGALVFEVGQFVEVTAVRSAIDETGDRLRRP